MSTFSLCQRNKSEVLRTWQSNVAIKRVMTNDWNKQSDADLLHSRVLRQYTNICRSTSLWPGFVRSRDIIGLVVLQGHRISYQDYQYFPLVVNQALINWAVAEQTDFHNRLSWLSDTDNLKLCPVNPARSPEDPETKQAQPQRPGQFVVYITDLVSNKRN